MPATCKDALKALEDSKKVRASDLAKVELWGQIPPIEKVRPYTYFSSRCRSCAALM